MDNVTLPCNDVMTDLPGTLFRPDPRGVNAMERDPADDVAAALIMLQINLITLV